MDEAVKIARERFADCQSAMSENHKRMLEDLRFSNPSDPQQWDRAAIRDRGDRPTLVFDQSNQYLAQVVNDARQNKPSMKVRPIDDQADVKVAKALNGLLYHIQDASRADIAYDTAIESAARVGLGWMRVVPEVVNAQNNEQEIRIKRVHEFDSILLDDASTEPDGSDAMDGFAVVSLSKQAFAKRWKGARSLSFDEAGWFGETVRVCEYFKVVEKLENYLSIIEPQSGQPLDVTEDELWDLCKQYGKRIPYTKQWTETKRSVKWTKLSGEEVLEETDFPASHIPLIPVLGNEVWIEGKRFLCGMVRKGMDAQRAYNFARSKELEVVMTQADAVPTIAHEAIEGFEDDWAARGTNVAYRRYNHFNDEGQQLPAPLPGQPPNYPVAFAQLSQTARDDLQAAFGMYKSNLGAPSNAVSGRAKMQDQREGDTANAHYLDNMRRSITHMGSIVIEMIPAIYDTKRVARILGLDGSQSQVIIDPNAPQAHQVDAQGKVTINPTIGSYDVTVSAGPAYATVRQEAAEQMTQLFQSNPQVFPLLGALWMKNQDWPFAEEAAQILKTMQPPQVQAIGQDENPQLKMAMDQVQHLQQQLQQVGQHAQMLEAQAKQKQTDQKMANHLEEQRNNIAAYQAETQRLAALVPADPQLANALYQQTLMTVMQTPSPFGGTGTALPHGVPAPQVQMGMGPPMQPPGGPPVAQAAELPEQPQGPSGPFSMPAQNGPPLQ